METTNEKVSAKEKTKLKIKLLRCYTSSEANGDEVYLKYEGKKIWPAGSYESVSSSNELSVNTEIVLNTPDKLARIDLWENDFFRDDHLGFFLFHLDGSNGEFTTDLTPKNKNDRYRYTLVWEFEKSTRILYRK
jgi:hypothetical protein